VIVAGIASDELSARDHTNKLGDKSSGPLARKRVMRRCVYTTLIGKYETLNEQPVAAASSFQFICLTDDPDLRSETWSVRCVAPVFGMDPIRSQRELKLRPHVHLAEFDGSLYMTTR